MNDFVTKKWNVVDSIIYKVETALLQIKNGWKDSKEELPDPEEMIDAATEQLRQENEQLKSKMYYPGHLIIEDELYLCPDCREPIEPEQIKKFCPECGKRIILQDHKYATSHISRSKE